jgi:hypothetical protein
MLHSNTGNQSTHWAPSDEFLVAKKRWSYCEWTKVCCDVVGGRTETMAPEVLYNRHFECFDSTNEAVPSSHRLQNLTRRRNISCRPYVAWQEFFKTINNIFCSSTGSNRLVEIFLAPGSKTRGRHGCTDDCTDDCRWNEQTIKRPSGNQLLLCSFRFCQRTKKKQTSDNRLFICFTLAMAGNGVTFSEINYIFSKYNTFELISMFFSGQI